MDEQPQNQQPNTQTSPHVPERPHIVQPVHASPTKKRLWPLYLIIIVAIAALGAGTYFLFLRSDPKKVADTTAKTEQTTPEPVQTDSTPVELKSDKLGLELTHRKDWAVTTNSTDDAITLTSPTLTYSTKDGTSKQGTFVLRLSQGADTATQGVVHNAFATKDFETIGYAAPLETQRYYTNVTIGGPADGSSFVLITGATGFKANDSLSSFFMNGDTYVFLGGFGTFKSDGTPAFDTLSKTALTSTEGYTQALDIIKSLKIH